MCPGKRLAGPFETDLGDTHSKCPINRRKSGTLAGGFLDFVVVLLLAVLLYQPKIKREEKCLAKKFGQAWNDYAKVTPSVVPRRLATGMLANWSISRWLHNEEYQAVVGVCFGLVLFGMWFQVVN